jgi:hypothetical protein
MWWDNSFSLFQVLMVSASLFLAGFTLGCALRVRWRKPGAVLSQVKEESSPVSEICIHCGKQVPAISWVSYYSVGSGMFLICPYCGRAKGR